MDIEITFINNSDDMNNSEIVIFQKNVATNFEETAIAWKVIQNCGRNWSHKFIYPMEFDVAAADSYGNVSDQQLAVNGQKWDVVRSTSGDVLQLDSNPGSSSTEVEVKNSLPTSSIDAQIYKNGNLLATKTGVSPGEKAVFEFEPYIYVGVNAQVVQSEIINSSILSDINQKFSLLGLTKASLIMTGGGTGVNATPFQFDLIPTS
ncbi:hypothetical protein [uncultured Aquimarina sp.]|uniref:hypothetical protein n=1 Tax=uncultured Aquimarina sp. TaxID=575652 RepID=UPI0026396DE7|nr:hypothetical protein [uncultured Aquimarina sp.]